MIDGLPRASLQVVPLRERRAGVLVPVRHPLVRRGRLTLEELVAHPLIVPEPAFFWRQRCDEVFNTAGLWERMHVSVEVSLIQAVEELVRRKVGVGLSPLVDKWRPGPGVTILPAAHLFPPDGLVLLRRRGNPRPQAQLLEELLLRSLD
jgi:LysR family cys regulon transcriptional activator